MRGSVCGGGGGGGSFLCSHSTEFKSRLSCRAMVHEGVSLVRTSFFPFLLTFLIPQKKKAAEKSKVVRNSGDLAREYTCTLYCYSCSGCVGSGLSYGTGS